MLSTSTRASRTSGALLLCCLVTPVFAGDATDKFRIEDATVLTGATGVQVPVLVENNFNVLGFSLGVRLDAALRVTGVTNDGTSSATADYFEGQVDVDGGLIGYGCVFDTNGDFGDQFLAPGVDQPIAIITVDVLADDATTAELTFDAVAIAPNVDSPVVNVLTNGEGRSVTPELDHGELTIITGAPEITDVLDGTGRAGSVFQVVGNHFDHSGLMVTVCGSEAAATLGDDGETIDVTAPDCAQDGCVDVVVATDRGEDTETDGFCYDPDPVPVVADVDPAVGVPGDEITITGENFGEAGLVVRICGVDAAHEAPTAGGTSVVVTVPASVCDPGPADVEVCNEFGCATRTGGFEYLDLAAVITDVQPPSGNPGAQITITGANFDEAGFVVRICGIDADHEAPTAGGTSVVVTVPGCDPGAVDVEVCNDFGCATDGFEVLVALDTFVRGDSDSNGTIELTDGIRILGFLFQGLASPTCMDAADSDDNGALELTDAVRIFGWLFSGGPPPLPPTPDTGGPEDCDVDPTDDGLGCETQSGVCS